MRFKSKSKFMKHKGVLETVILILAFGQAPAQWSNNAAVNNGIAVFEGNQTNARVISDGNGGAIIVWQDDRNGNDDIFMARIKASGQLDDDFNNDIAVLQGSQIAPTLVANGDTGAFVTWQDDRNSIGSNFDIYAQKISLPLGQGHWGPNGVNGARIQTGNNYVFPNIIRDSIFGAIVASYTFRDGNHLIFLQKLDNKGSPQWPSFSKLNENHKVTQPEQPPTIISDENRGVIVVWADQRNPASLQVYAARLDGSMNPVWPGTEVALSSSLENNTVPAAIADGRGGAIVAWIAPSETLSTNHEIKVQRINSQGMIQWDNFGRTISNSAGKKEDVKIVRVNADTICVLWIDLGSGQDRDVRIQRLNSMGQEIESEFDIVRAIGDQENPVLISNKRDGIIVAWEDDRAGQTDIYAQLIEPNGKTDWGENGIAVSTAANIQQNPTLIDDNLGGAIVVWEDRRSGSHYDIYLQRISKPGIPGENRNVTLLSPDTSTAVWEIGSTQEIKWTSQGELDSISIELSRDGGTTYQEVIARAVAILDERFFYEVTGPAKTDCKIKISASNAGFIFDESEQTFTIAAAAGPTIALSDTAKEISVGDSIQVTASAIDNTPIKNVMLNIRKGGAGNFESFAMSAVAADTFRTAFPESFITERGLEYFVSSQDTLLNSATSDTFFVVVNFGSAVQTRQITRGSSQTAYRMISAPNLLTESSADSIFDASGFGVYDTTSWRLFYYRDSVYVERDSLNANTFTFTPGKAYWLISARDRVIDFGAGKSLRADTSYVLSLKPGWNQVGHPFAFDVDWDSVLIPAESDTLVQAPFLYEDTYGIAEKLQPYKGYFIFNRGRSEVEIEIPPVASEGVNRSLARANASTPGWALQLKAICGQARDEFNYIGIIEFASDTWDPWDYTEPPPIGDYISILFPRKEWPTFPGNYTTDYRKQIGEGQTWSFQVKSNIANAEAKIHIAGLEVLPSDLEIRLLDEKLNILQNLRRENEYSFPTGQYGSVKTLKLLVGKSGFMADETADDALIPKEFELSQNFPNPFNPTTTIRFGLPSSGKVSLQVYDLLGRLVATLLDEEPKETGFHIVTWNGQDNHGRAVASGLYIYQIIAGDFSQTRKMILVK